LHSDIGCPALFLPVSGPGVWTERLAWHQRSGCAQKLLSYLLNPVILFVACLVLAWVNRMSGPVDTI